MFSPERSRHWLTVAIKIVDQHFVESTKNYKKLSFGTKYVYTWLANRGCLIIEFV